MTSGVVYYVLREKGEGGFYVNGICLQKFNLQTGNFDIILEITRGMNSFLLLDDGLLHRNAFWTLVWLFEKTYGNNLGRRNVMS